MARAEGGKLKLVSLMAKLKTAAFAEKALIPSLYFLL